MEHKHTHEAHPRQKESFIGIPGAIILSSIILAFAVFAGMVYYTSTVQPQGGTAKADSKPLQPVPPVQKDDLVFGNKDAKVTLIEYSDLECPFCNRFHSTINEVLATYPNDVKYVLRHYPLPFHPNAPMYGQALECVYSIHGPEKAYDTLGAIFQNQPLKTNTNDAKILATFIANTISVESSPIESCITSNKFAGKITRDMQTGQAAGVSGTPSGFILGGKGGVQTIGGAQPFTAVKAQIDAVLK